MARSHTAGFVTHFGNACESCLYRWKGRTAAVGSMVWMSASTVIAGGTLTGVLWAVVAVIWVLFWATRVATARWRHGTPDRTG